ncbi:hypothetical protein M409DRAFT_27276 [Zasmidium cellare ATCC 36951]|uniref:Uncharacterized protein n=1 Tax=Zasmidium cellare ATCC 36951 TaxID=1080233 RepID=A0A6A6C5V6_ZASCE|nr:uncharacterized protein M409DRAFT_27276 [Zasmidium cellare ATCC 36951]KAF2162273.1 hypothetical protein M409DRAFT_27276 [Zasmidium cellare ATCC 36951]
MARIFRLSAEYHQPHLHSGWASLLRRFTRQPTWKRVSRYDNLLSRVGNIDARKGSAQSCWRPAGVCKRAATSPSPRSVSTATQPPKRAWYSSPKRKNDDSIETLTQLLRSPDFLNEIIFTLRGGEILREKRKQCRLLRDQVRSLRSQADNIQNDLIVAQGQRDMVALSFADRDRQRVSDLRAQAQAAVSNHNRLNDEENHGSRVFMLACNGITKSIKPRLEQARLLDAMDEDAIRARLLASLPENDIFLPEQRQRIATAPRDENKNGELEASAEQQGKEALLAARLRAFAIYEEAQTVFKSHHEKYTNQLSNHLKGISPGWPDWDASWTQADFDAYHLHLSMQHSTALREAEEALFKAIDDAHSGGLSPMQPFQIYGYHDHPDDNPADSVRDAPTGARIDAWRNTLPSLPPLPEPFGPDVVQYPSEQMSDLDGDVEAWETWSQRDEDVQRKRLLEKYRGPRPLGWTLPAEEGGVNGGDGGRSMNSHMI